jgi:hypothetical protein
LAVRRPGVDPGKRRECESELINNYCKINFLKLSDSGSHSKGEKERRGERRRRRRRRRGGGGGGDLEREIEDKLRLGVHHSPFFS